MATETQETTMVTERQAVQRERAAYARGAQDRMRVETSNVPTFPGVYTACGFHGTSLTAAEKHYPLPKVTRPRVVRIGAYEFRACGERIEERFANEGANWREASAFPLTAHNVNTWADLLANPTEEVDDA